MKDWTWPHCPPPRDFAEGALWEDLLKDAALMTERAAPQALLKRECERTHALDAMDMPNECLRSYRREPDGSMQRQPLRTARPWVFVLSERRRRR